jgi:hypothetical protein
MQRRLVLGGGDDRVIARLEAGIGGLVLGLGERHAAAGDGGKGGPEDRSGDPPQEFFLK